MGKIADLVKALLLELVMESQMLPLEHRQMVAIVEKMLDHALALAVVLEQVLGLRTLRPEDQRMVVIVEKTVAQALALRIGYPTTRLQPQDQSFQMVRLSTRRVKDWMQLRAQLSQGCQERLPASFSILLPCKLTLRSVRLQPHSLYLVPHHRQPTVVQWARRLLSLMGLSQSRRRSLPSPQFLPLVLKALKALTVPKVLKQANSPRTVQQARVPRVVQQAKVLRVVKQAKVPKMLNRGKLIKVPKQLRMPRAPQVYKVLALKLGLELAWASPQQSSKATQPSAAPRQR